MVCTPEHISCLLCCACSVLWQLFHYVPLQLDGWQRVAEHQTLHTQWEAYQKVYCSCSGCSLPGSFHRKAASIGSPSHNPRHAPYNARPDIGFQTEVRSGKQSTAGTSSGSIASFTSKNVLVCLCVCAGQCPVWSGGAECIQAWGHGVGAGLPPHAAAKHPEADSATYEGNPRTELHSMHSMLAPVFAVHGWQQKGAFMQMLMLTTPTSSLLKVCCQQHRRKFELSRAFAFGCLTVSIGCTLSLYWHMLDTCMPAAGWLVPAHALPQQ
jgi:hypothetical protein